MVFRVLDASAFYAGIPFSSQEQHYTTSLIFDEIKHIKKDHDALGVLLDSKRLVLKDPDTQFTDKVTESAKKTGDWRELSNADVSAIALCLQLKVELVTDDYAVSNVAKMLGIRAIPVMTSGISKSGSWIHYCAACRKNFTDLQNCPICGNKLRRKLLRGQAKPA